jgi:hypothetical protein
MTPFVRIADLLLQARHLQIMEIYHSDSGTPSQVQVLEILTQVLDRNLKLQPDDHIGKKVVITDSYFEDYIPATITWQDFDNIGEVFTLFYNHEEYGGFTRNQFKFVDGD